MEAVARSGRLDAVAPRPLAELLDCPPMAGTFLNRAAKTVELAPGQHVFRQGAACRGLYVVVSGQFVRKTERMKARLTLGKTRAGDLVELAAALGDGVHTYTLCAQSEGTLLMLPIEDLRCAFQSYPPLRMKLLEELAREVSRAYIACSMNPPPRPRRHIADENAVSTAIKLDMRN
ncbi:MAG TPA: cyclic nucleotide-binding domain-containing protein [Terracidiphilus sp.]|nr:cyclic nucleotide-binding domain-containing protein [Terracidiphilus sp.]